MMERAFVIAAFGDRQKQAARLVGNIRSYSDLPIHILTTDESQLGIPLMDTQEYQYDVTIELVEPVWTGQRAEIRNSNYWKIQFALAHHYHSLCMLDDDMYIVDKNFIGGFEIAENFGAAIPINPRTFNCYNMMGADVRQRDLEIVYDDLGIPTTIPAVNFSPFFVYPHAGLTSNFLQELASQLKEVPCRGTVAVIKAMWKTNYTPVILPEQWCVCASNAQYIKDHIELLRGRQISIPTIMLHLGHDEVRRVYNVE